MKRIIQLFSLALLTAFTSGQINAQYTNYEDDSGWNIGFNMGALWQQSDVKSVPGFAGGMTLGKSIYEKEGSLLSLDWRVRYLTGYNSGRDLTLSTDIDSIGVLQDYAANGHYNNHKMFVSNMWDLEGVITLNRLKENTGIILYGFGGIGVTGYSLKADLLDQSGNAYDYSNIGNGSVFGVQQDLEFERDGEYETELHKGYEFMPSLGFGLGYQFGPSFSMGLEHKINFPLHDDLDGFRRAPEGRPVNDRLHYTGVTFRWNILRGRTNPPVVVNPVDPVVPVDPIVSTPVRNKPIVNIINPMHSPHTTHNSSYTIKANVYYVDGASNITFRHNGVISTNFSYNVSSKRFTSNVFLVPGKNVFEIVGTNQWGIDSDSKIIIYEQVINTIPPPIVTFSNPSSSPRYVTTAPFTITATILNVNGPQDITFKVNGHQNPNFNYNISNKIFSSNIVLSEGQNTVEITGVNSVGQDVESVMIIYTKPIQLQPPVVNFTQPSSTPTNVTSAQYNVYCQVLHVQYHHQIQVSINGASVPYFNFNPTAHNVSFQASLMEGSNVVTVTGTNNDGTDSESTTIIYKDPVQMPPPIVTITKPTNNPHNTSVPAIDVYANVLHVNGKSDITLKINGVQTTNFNYNIVNKIMSITTGLVNGSNVFSIVAKNSVGTDNAGTTVIYKKPATLLPPIISITKPISNPYNTIIEQEMINAKIINVIDASHVAAKFNGIATNAFTFDPVSRNFSYNATLIVGANILEITAWNTAGNAAKTQTIIYTQEAPPCSNPVIALTQPANSPFVITNPKAAVVGKITGSQSISVKINGVTTPGYNFNAATGAFEMFINNPVEGANVYELTAVNNCGMVQKTVTIIYKKQAPPCISPSIVLSSPNSYSTSTNSATFNFAAYAQEVKVKSKISLTVNGKIVAFTFDAASKQVSANLVLKPGSNVVLLKASNLCGADEATIRMDSRNLGGGITLPPTVVITTPSATSYTSPTPSTVVLAKVARVGSKSEISTNYDGNVVPFTFNATSKIVTVPLSLTEGSHNLEITVANANGSATDQVELIYKKEEVPCIPPTITLDAQFNSLLAVNVAAGTITGKANNATSMVVKMNGSAHTNFTFNQTTGDFVITYSGLNHGNNDFDIYGYSDCGRPRADVTIDFNPPVVPCDEPTLVIAEASGTSVSVTNETGMFTAYVGNATSVIVLKGGSGYSNFTYNQTSGNVVVNYSALASGANVFTIKAVNNCGDTAGDYTINYTPSVPCTDPVINLPPSVSANMYNVPSLPYSFNVSTVDATSIAVQLNGSTYSGYTFNAASGQVVLTVNSLNNGSNPFEITAQNDCGVTAKSSTFVYSTPCVDPVVSVDNPTVAVTDNSGSITVNTQDATSAVATLNGVNYSNIVFNNATGALVINLTGIVAGSNNFEISAQNECGVASGTLAVNYTETTAPCDDPIISLGSPSATVTDLTGNITVNTQHTVSAQLTLNGAEYSNFTFNGVSGILTIGLAGMVSGNNDISIEATNDCGSVNSSILVIYNAPVVPAGPCGPRFNPGSSEWQFCLVTPSGTYNRDDLTSGFTYSGSASSAYFKPIAGGGDAIVNGNPYSVSNGQYYLFTGSLTVDVSSSHPGSMGHWEICIESNSAPSFGNGSNRPASPCETTSSGVGNGNGGGNGNGNGGGENSGGENGNGDGNGNGGGENGNGGENDNGGAEGNGGEGSVGTGGTNPSNFEATEAAKKAEEARKAAEAAREAEAARKATDAARKAEAARNAEAARKAAADAKNDDAAKKAEAARKAAADAKNDDAARKAEAARKATEDARRAEEAKRKADAARKATEDARRAEEAKRSADAARKAEAARKATEDARRAEEAKRSADAARKAEAARKATEDARRAEEAKRKAEAARKAAAAKKAESAKKAEAAKKAAAAKALEEKKKADAAKAIEEKKKADAAAAAKKKAAATKTPTALKPKPGGGK